MIIFVSEVEKANISRTVALVLKFFSITQSIALPQGLPSFGDQESSSHYFYFPHVEDRFEFAYNTLQTAMGKPRKRTDKTLRLQELRWAFQWQSLEIVEAILEESLPDEFFKQFTLIEDMESGLLRTQSLNRCIRKYLQMPPQLLALVSQLKSHHRLLSLCRNSITSEVINYWDVAFPLERFSRWHKCPACKVDISRYTPLCGSFSRQSILFCCGRICHVQCRPKQKQCPYCFDQLETFQYREHIAESRGYSPSQDRSLGLVPPTSYLDCFTFWGNLGTPTTISRTGTLIQMVTGEIVGLPPLERVIVREVQPIRHEDAGIYHNQLSPVQSDSEEENCNK